MVCDSGYEWKVCLLMDNQSVCLTQDQGVCEPHFLLTIGFHWQETLISFSVFYQVESQSEGTALVPTLITSVLKKWELETSLVVQWLRCLTPNAQGQGLIPGQGTRSHMLQLRAHIP